MSEFNISKATTTDFTGGVPDFVVNAKTLDAVNKNSEETYKYYGHAPEMIGYVYEIPEIANAASALCTWAFSRGWEAQDDITKQELKHIRGLGNQTFSQLMWSHEFMKLVVGDAFMEVKYSDDRKKILNMIPISPERVRSVWGKTGLIKRYDVWNGSEWKAVKQENMYHSTNKRLADQMGGLSIRPRDLPWLSYS